VWLARVDADALQGADCTPDGYRPHSDCPARLFEKEKNRPKQPKPCNSNRAVTNSLMTPVTITGMTGHDAGIIGHDQRNKQQKF